MCLVVLWAPSGERRQPLSKAHVSMHRRGDIEGIAATSRSEERGVEDGRDRTHVDLHSHQHALREQHLAAPQAWRQAARGPEGVTNLGLVGQYVELERDIAFTFEY